MNHNFNHSNIENCNNIMALPSSSISDNKTKTPINKNKPALTQSCVILPSQLLRKSLICNSLAQACSLKRALDDNNTRADYSTTVSSSSLSLQSSSSSQLCLKKSKSDSSMMAKFTYKNHHRITNPRAIKVISSSTMGHLLNEEWKNTFTADDLSSSSSSSSYSSSSSTTSSLYDLSHLSAGSAALALAVGGCNSSSSSSNNIVSITSSTPSSTASSATTTPMLEDDTDDNNMCPYTYMKNIFAAANDDDGLSSDNDDNTTPSNPSWMQPLHETEFHPPTQEQIDAYTNDAVSAVRSSNLQTLRDIHTTHGPTYLKCCNRYGESLLHIACRRSTSTIVSFLLNEVNVSPNIKDDYGRTPLHDACWRGMPEYDIVELLLKKEPKLLWCKDVRGYLPLNYARREHWKGWNGFLDDRGRELLCMSL